jgi:ubiquinone/menaquinone biosynthesis C-methylase UbiE
MFEVAEAYEVIMGRWSRQLAPMFVEFVGVRDGERVLDVGCGTGALSATLARVTGASKIVGIHPSSGFIEYARRKLPIRGLPSRSATHRPCLTPTNRSTDPWHYSS